MSLEEVTSEFEIGLSTSTLPVKRQSLADITDLLNTVETSVSGLPALVSELLAEIEDLDVQAILETIKETLASDIQLVEQIVAAEGVTLDLSSLVGEVNDITDIVKGLEAQVSALVDDSAAGPLVSEITSLISELLATLGELV